EATPLSTTLYSAISLLGSIGMWIVGLIVAIFFILRKRWLNLAVWVMALAGGILLNDILKGIFARERPSFVDPLAIEQTFSFPSGHAMMSLICYGLLAYFVWHTLRNHYGRILLIFGVSLLIVLIGISRMTL